ncbi:hypothetical protein SAMN06265795_10749 [Noviherbaspirillum humi]|uniref:Uncharacterized protein n=1 Tax=Noviherbaspirillum humi TaxID=1688639 RepID=A0A239HLU2_9BURK|nr:hypothetical protein [Noviherbaspirillum humi]SNS82115.1 hypothetical protein SAMN06265795_10749 [Noviherbaspirillum humi]
MENRVDDRAQLIRMLKTLARFSECSANRLAYEQAANLIDSLDHEIASCRKILRQEFGLTDPEIGSRLASVMPCALDSSNAESSMMERSTS